MKTLRAVVWTIALGVFLMVSMTVAAETVNVGLVAKKDQALRYQPLEKHLNRGGEHRFEFVFYSTIDALYEDFQKGEVRLAVVGSVFYAKARQKSGVVPIVKDRSNVSTIIVRADSKIRTLEDLRGRKMALGYPDSTTSNLIPRMELWQHKIGKDELTEDAAEFANDPQKILVTYTGSHTAVVESVLDGRADVGAVVDAVFENNRERGLRVIRASEAYPGPPLICRRDEPEAFRLQVRELFTSFQPVTGAENAYFSEGARVANDSDYDSIRYLCNIVLDKNYPVR